MLQSMHAAHSLSDCDSLFFFSCKGRNTSRSLHSPFPHLRSIWHWHWNWSDWITFLIFLTLILCMPIYSLRCVVTKTRLEPERFTTNQLKDPLDVRVSEFFALFLSKLLRLKGWINKEVDVFLQRAPIPLPKTISHISNRPSHASRKVRKTALRSQKKAGNNVSRKNANSIHVSQNIQIQLFQIVFKHFSRHNWNVPYLWSDSSKYCDAGPAVFLELFASTVDRCLSRISYHLSSYGFLRRRL